MLRHLLRLTMAALLCAVVSIAHAQGIPERVVPDGLGVNIHFLDAQPGELEMLAEAGFRFIRMDFIWSATEREKGKYDFSAYDRLLAALDKHKIRAILILDYVNPHYDNGLSPGSDEGRRAFARWAVAAAHHFRGRGVAWEMYNEPNGGFWKPQTDIDQYIKLALEVGKAMHAAEPGELHIGPASVGVDTHFLEKCFKAGLLEYWSAISVHPYRQTPPEAVAAEYQQLRALIARYAPKGKQIPILAGEWGYSSVWSGHNDAIQGKYLPRQWLVNLANDVPISIWYDWHDDGLDPKEPEHHFGTVATKYFAGRKPVYDPKPAYLAAKTLTAQLAGFRYNKRLTVGKPDNYVLLFSKGDDVRLAAWTTSKWPREVSIPASPGRFLRTGHTGEKLAPLTTDSQGLCVTLSDEPQYLVPEAKNDLLRIAAAWTALPLEVRMAARPQAPLRSTTLSGAWHELMEVRTPNATLSSEIRNPLDRAIRVRVVGSEFVPIAPGAVRTFAIPFTLLRIEQAQPFFVGCDVEGLGTVTQSTEVFATNPLQVVIGPPAGGRWVVRVEDPAGEKFDGKAVLDQFDPNLFNLTARPLRLDAANRVALLEFASRNDSRCLVQLRLSSNQHDLIWSMPKTEFIRLDDFTRYTPEQLAKAWTVVPDGDPKVKSEQSLAMADIPAGAPIHAAKTLALSYRMDAGWKFLRIVPKEGIATAIEGKPKSLVYCVYGNASGDTIVARFVDATGQTHQPNGGRLDFTGWRQIVVPLDTRDTAHWGGANDGVIHYPIRWDTPILIDGTRSAHGPTQILFTSPVVVY